MLDPLIYSIVEEQIAGYRSSAALFTTKRADLLAQAQAAATDAAGATARADELQAALDAIEEPPG